ncbi:Protein TolB [bacterium HR24]|nr:Protein TolB [bacterium HR24]
MLLISCAASDATLPQQTPTPAAATRTPEAGEAAQRIAVEPYSGDLPSAAGGRQIIDIVSGSVRPLSCVEQVRAQQADRSTFGFVSGSGPEWLIAGQARVVGDRVEVTQAFRLRAFGSDADQGRWLVQGAGWPPDSRQFALWTEPFSSAASFGKDDASELYVFDSETGSLLRLFGTTGLIGDAEWSPQGDRLAVMYRAPGLRVAIVSAAGGPPVEVQAPAGMELVLASRCRDLFRASCWSPDGSLVALERAGANWPEGIYVATADGSRLQAVVEGPASFVQWGPDSRSLLALVGQEGAAWELQVRYLDGRQPVRIGEAWFAGWSPDGRLIAYTRGECAAQELVLTDPSGATSRVLATGLGAVLGFVWSPRGDFLALSSLGRPTDNAGLLLVEPSTRAAHRLSNDPMLVSWAPTGGQLIAAPFVGDRCT